MKRFLTLLFFSLPFFAFSQQDAQFSQYMFNQLYYNPAVAGVDPNQIEFLLIHRSQWLGYDGTFDNGGAPTTQMASVNMPLSKYNLGLGLHFVNDQLGPVTNQEVQLSLGYHIDIKKGSISFGLRGGMYNHSMDFDKYRPVDNDDPLISQQGKQSQFTGDFAAGIYYKSNRDKYFLGVSVNHLNKSEFNYGTDISYNILENHYSVMGGVNVDLSRSVVLSPSAILKTDLNTYSIEASLISTFNKKFYVGLSMRELESAIILTGIKLLPDKSLKLGYAFDYTIEAKNAKETTSHELMLTYRIPAIQIFEPAIIRTPRYRY
ncbi:PorP/SprF family type IX secretion system membrane protein [Flexithrix dorotheae]|uniref:PorP/SprF family type IX secretion system membrane protein n=1 Tax=Flexithrix dorotheae TaxID=70993 RepID=UPI00035FBE1C|nr:type IX secretion system membrane protein PorP/SprF [Flexithrix dorotheae]